MFYKYFDVAILYISAFNNIVQFFALLMGVYAIFYVFYGKYGDPIDVLLRPLGFPRFPHLLKYKIIFLCRNNARFFIRVFCEYSIIKCEGSRQSTDWWKKSYAEFVPFFKENLSCAFVYEIDNCTDILSNKISDSIKQYFEYFETKKAKKKFNLDTNLPVSFCMDFFIKQGYVSANFLVSGLLSRYQENWKSLVSKFISISCRENNCGVDYSGISLAFVWLLWGPSYQLKNQEGYYKLCQYAFGDENNSIYTVIKDDEKFAELWSDIRASDSGFLCSLRCSLYRDVVYFSRHNDKFSPYNKYFLDKIKSDGTGFILEVNDFKVCKDYKYRNYYCTAYVWIMFVGYSTDGEIFDPGKMITFFEHANLADQKNFIFSVDSLINKCFLYFENVLLNNEKYKYRYCLSMNNYIEKLFLSKLDEKNSDDKFIEKLSNVINVDKIYSEQVIFNAIDLYFSNFNDEYDFIEVNASNEESIALLGEFYVSIYVQEFKNPNERESLESLLDYLQKKEISWYGKNNYHIFLLTKFDKITKYKRVVAGLICDYFYHSNCGVIEFIAVKREFQSHGIGSKIYNLSVDRLKQDSYRAGYKSIKYLFCEIEKPDFKTKFDSKYLYFWNNLKYKIVSFDYVQPALDLNKTPVSSLYLLSFPVCELEKNNAISKQILIDFLFDYAKYAMRINNPCCNADVNTMVLNLSNRESDLIELLQIQLCDSNT